ncbi:protein Tube-like isoform X2 [Bradysia coprophila]|uniref:protein Tube-like isoform X2 n=1 Tax=Bradysia coprophila TaxID=38358 RepID=UPI00187DD1FB|nr:protein Tube-like isoform X2 [Bradysia coprophila]XP_037025170.1 protein Tube-like isoform X2 [Bradysia coprophila]
MAFTRRTEVRHISQAELIKIAEILNVPSSSPAWKKVMQIVPSELIDHEQLNDCKPKYNIQNIRSIEKAGGRLKNSAYIFLEEWMTSGKIRPTLSHLLQLLVKSELWRAAEYVAINLLSEAPPQRPTTGPAAKIDISLPDDLGGIDNELLNGNYPNTSEIMDLNRCLEAASKNIASKQIFDRSLMPDRPISEQDLIRMATAPQLSQDVASTPVQTTNHLTRRPEHRDSQIQLSHVNSEDSQSNTGDIPNLSIFNVADGTASGQPECAARNVPYFSQITDRSQSTSGSAMSRVYSNDEGENSTGNVPHLSELMGQLNNQTNCSASAINPMDRISSVPTLTSLPNFSQLLNQSQSLDNRGKKQNSTDHHESPNGNIPHFSQLLSQSHPTSDNLTSEQNSNDTQECFDGNVPHLSQLLSQSHPTTDEGESFEANVPHLSQLVNQSIDGSGA